MEKTPKGMRLHIGIFGRRNVGKSSFLNSLTRQQVSIVSDTPGTTTDPVEKPMELLPVGPVLFIDTAGVDDVGALGEMRVKVTEKVFDRTDVAVIVAVASEWGPFEEKLLDEFGRRKIPAIVMLNKADIAPPARQVTENLTARKIPFIPSIASQGVGVPEFREELVRVVPEDFLSSGSIAGDLVPPGEMAVLVVPIDLEAPKGRLILPQVQTIRDLLDNDSCCMVVKERELRSAMDRLKRPPALVVTDSQAFLKVAADVPDDVPLTSFSILFARYKGDLETFAQGAMAIGNLRPGDRVLIAEACSHHPIGEDIGRVKIPRWLTQFVGGKLDFHHIQGHDFPEDISSYRLVVHCGSCVFNRRALLSRILKCRELSIPVTNYGLAIAYSLGILERALSPFPGIAEICREKARTGEKR